MLEKDFFITIITLTKNDNLGFYRTVSSIFKQNIRKNVELLILDGSDKEIFKDNKNILQKFSNKNNSCKKYLFFTHIRMDTKSIQGIYPSMNYGLKISKGKSIIFLNGGDSFFDNHSLRKLDEFSNKYKRTISFGQAKIISKIGLSWNFPGSKIKNILLWLKFFEPNHQTMLVSADIAKNTIFGEGSKISADKFWKREVLSKADTLRYIDTPVCNFYLNGISSKRPNMEILLVQIKDKNISFLDKLINIIKFLIFPGIYKYFPYLQKLKSSIIDLIF